MTTAEVCLVTGFADNTIRKYVECDILQLVKPRGVAHGRLRKVQVAKLIGLELTEDRALWAREPMMLREKAVRRWTGFSSKTIRKLARVGSLTRIRLPGGEACYRKTEVGELIGMK